MKFFNRHYKIAVPKVLWECKEVDELIKTIKKASKGDTITIQMDGNGGCADLCERILKLLNACPATVNMIVEKQAVSSYAILLERANKIIIHKDATVLVHVGSYMGDRLQLGTSVHSDFINAILNNICMRLPSEAQEVFAKGNDVVIPAPCLQRLWPNEVEII